MTNYSQSFDITIFGAGISGMISALGFASIGKKVLLVDIATKKTNDNRTTALTKYSWQFLSRVVSNIDELENLAGRIADIYVLDNKSDNQMLHFPAKLLQEEKLGYIVKNTEFKDVLLRTVENNSLISINTQPKTIKIDNHEYGCTIHLAEGQKVKSDLIVICSGINSVVYQRYFQPRLLKEYGYTALTFNVIHEKPHEGTAVEHFMPAGPFAILPLKDPCGSSIVWTLQEKLVGIYSKMNLEEFTYHVEQNFGEFLGKVKLDSDINYFPLKAYLCEKYFYKRAVLVADSAHITHPLAGQGLNQGIKDIKALVKLVEAKDISHTTLEQYQKLRYNDNIAMYLITDNINRVFSNYNPVLSFARKLALKAIDQISPLKKSLMRYAYGER